MSVPESVQDDDIGLLFTVGACLAVCCHGARQTRRLLIQSIHVSFFPFFLHNLFFTNSPCHSFDYSFSLVYLVLINSIMASTFSHPFSTSSSPQPHTSKQWELVLQRVKLLYAQRQYKQCAAQVEEILMMAREPVSVLTLVCWIKA